MLATAVTTRVKPTSATSPQIPPVRAGKSRTPNRQIVTRATADLAATTSHSTHHGATTSLAHTAHHSLRERRRRLAPISRVQPVLSNLARTATWLQSTSRVAVTNV